jgi:hypothetical protein
LVWAEPPTTNTTQGLAAIHRLALSLSQVAEAEAATLKTLAHFQPPAAAADLAAAGLVQPATLVEVAVLALAAKGLTAAMDRSMARLDQLPAAVVAVAPLLAAMVRQARQAETAETGWRVLLPGRPRDTAPVAAAGAAETARLEVVAWAVAGAAATDLPTLVPALAMVRAAAAADGTTTISLFSTPGELVPLG